jgi:ABC-type glycerol-3-phosphate transport system permease component
MTDATQAHPAAPERAAARSLGSEVAVSAILVLLAAAVVVPLFLPWFFVFKTRLEYFNDPWGLPTRILWDNFREAWSVIQIGQGLANTIVVCTGAVAATVPPAAMAGYVFARYRSRFTEFAFYAILAGYFVPIQMVLIPLYRISVEIRMVDTLPGLFLPLAAFGIPFWTLIYRSFFRSLPGELADAARIDGSGHTGTFVRIMLPLAGPATVLAVILSFLGAWNDYLLSLIMINSRRFFTMQLSVSQFLNAYGVAHMPRYSAAALISAAPTVLLYIVGHRWILRGTLAGAFR